MFMEKLNTRVGRPFSIPSTPVRSVSARTRKSPASAWNAPPQETANTPTMGNAALYVTVSTWGTMAERFSASDLSSDGCLVSMWVRILAATVVLVSLSKALYCDCFSLPRSINGYLRGVEMVMCLISPVAP